MSGEGNEFRTFVTNIYGGTGGVGGVGGILGGAAGAGEGPTMNFGRVQNLTNNIRGSLVVHSDRLEEILGKWLEFPPDTKDRQYHLRSLHHKDTGSWLLHDDRFIKWKAMPGSLWIKGISGTGKSVLRCSTVIEEITVTCPEQSAVAYFYFDFSNNRQHMDIMSDWKPLVLFIHSLCHPTKNALHLLFTSQLLQEFQIAFKDVTFIELGPAVLTGDIRSFVGSEISRIKNWASDNEDTKNVTEQIVQKSDGMFRMAACLLIELHSCHFRDDVEEALTTLPADLFGIYRRFLIRAKDSIKKTVFIQAIFQWLMFSARKIASDELADAMAFSLSDPEFNFFNPAKSTYDPNRWQGNSNIFKLLEGLIVIKDDGSAKGSIALAHSSVKDYLLSSHFQKEFGIIIALTKEVSHKFIAQTCVRYLLLFADANHLMTKATLPDYPISLYAAKYWFHHLQLCDNWDQEALLPSTMHLLEDGSSQYTALYQLHHFEPDWASLPWGVQSLLIKHSKSVNQADEYGRAALHFASSKGHLDIVQLLIEHSASVNQADKDGKTALHLTLREGHLNIVQLLIEHSTSVNQADKDGRTALHLASSKGHPDIIQLLIEHSASVNQADKYGTTTLHLASCKGHPNIVQLLIEYSASVGQADKNAAHKAQEGHPDIVQLLIEHSTSVNQADKDGMTALHLASSRGHLNVVQLLIEHSASVNQADKYGTTALHLASREGHPDITQLLIEHSTSVNQTNLYGRTMLLIERSTSVDQADIYGRTTLHLPSSSGHLNIMQLLIERNTPVNQADRYGRTALHLASSRGHLDIVQLLIEHSASVNQPDGDGMTALHLALREGHPDIAQLLIECSTSVNQADEDGMTVLHPASSSGHLNIALLQV
ncbi:Pfs domain-containing protein [Mycena venus]|uniref:Pfs domain-containing protein n=1 Tax=Mycena venus TaxID=2733690 RepID=A0A8H7D4C3_9AGAR|nr:Pfs domain-containing protein [Mycena venus]